MCIKNKNNLTNTTNTYRTNIEIWKQFGRSGTHRKCEKKSNLMMTAISVQVITIIIF